jgi:hypothetical protein
MKRTFLLTGARAPVTLDLARALSRAGHRVIGAESLPHALSRRSNAFAAFHSVPAPNDGPEAFRHAIGRIIEQEGVEVLVPTCEEVFHLAPMRAEGSRRLLMWFDQPEMLRRLHSKVEFNSLALEAGLAVPFTFRATGPEELRSAIEAIGGDRVVLKPEYSRFATRTLILDRPDALRTVPDLANGTAWCVQEFLPGKEYCSYSLAREGRLLAHLTYSHEFKAGRGAGICFESVPQPAIRDWVDAFVRRTGFTGQIAFDFIEDETGQVRALECNPRATSGLHLFAGHEGFSELLAGAAPDLEPAAPSVGSSAQLRLAMLVYGLPSVRSWHRLGLWCSIFFGAREVVFDRRDPLPFLDQFISFYQLIRAGLREEVTPLEASTRDIEWNGP